MYYVGLDIHHRSTSVEILDCNGKLVKRGEWKLPWSELADQLKKDAPAPFAVCFEASCGYGYLFEEFSRVAQMVKAAHPGSLRLIYKAKRKNNRVDAGKLARLLYLDAVPSVYVPGKETRLWRQTIEFRQTLLTRLVTRDDPDRKKIAIVATAHYLTRVAVSMLKSGEVWREDSRLVGSADSSDASSPGEGRTDKDPKCSPLPRTTTAEVREDVVAPTPLPSPVSSVKENDRGPAN